MKTWSSTAYPDTDYIQPVKKKKINIFGPRDMWQERWLHLLGEKRAEIFAVIRARAVMV